MFFPLVFSLPLSSLPAGPHVASAPNDIEGPLLKKGKMKSQQRYFKTVSHYLLYRTSKVGDDYDGGVDLQGPQSTITLSADTKTLTVIGLDSTHADGELRELRTMELSAAKASAKAPKAPTIHEWCDQLLECQVGARFWFWCFCELGFLPPYYSYPHSPDHFDVAQFSSNVCVCVVLLL